MTEMQQKVGAIPARYDAAPIPALAGIGLRHPHHRWIAETRPPVPWLEVHAENFMRGGPSLDLLADLRRDYPVSLHGVGLSLGSADPIDSTHLARLKALTDRIEPGLVSEHVSWSIADGAYLNDLLPLPYTEEALAHLIANIDRAQNALGRTILIENPSTYFRFVHSEMDEAAFIAEALRRSGCGLLLDLNNVYVSARNHGFDEAAYIAALPADRIAEIHLAGHSLKSIDGCELRIDDHGSEVCDEVWALFRTTIARNGPVPTLIEWDAEIPPLETLIAEAAKAQRVLDRKGGTSDDARAA
ncbi:MAG: DUF692 domain-containing protein [Dongiaceae bacterium]